MSKPIHPLISLKDAQEILLRKTPCLRLVRLPLKDSFFGYSAEDLFSSVDIPNTDTSMMDGYAVSVSESGRWRLRNKPVKAGARSLPLLKQGEGVAIYTGAPIPKGTASVVPVEQTEVDKGLLSARIFPSAGSFIRKKGTDLKKGELILKKGSRLDAAAAGLLASAGIADLLIYKKPRVAVLTTGDELVIPGRRLKKGEAYDSNGVSLISAISKVGLEAGLLGHSGDDPAEMLKAIELRLNEYDCFIVTGGASVGEYDFTARVFKKLGVKLHFERSAIKPGKPALFGTLGKKVFFGLPGNPVAALVTFELYVKPALKGMMGAPSPLPEVFTGTILSSIYGEPERLHLIRGRARFKEGRFLLEPVGSQTSSFLKGLAEANCLIFVPAGVRELQKGDETDFLWLKSVE